MRRAGRLLGVAALAVLSGAARPCWAQGEAPLGCTPGYARAFPALHEAASALRLKVDTAQDEVAQLFQRRPDRCEPGAFNYFLEQLMSFARRALRSGATATSPKEGWVRAATLAAAYGPRVVPQGEYYDDLDRLSTARLEIGALVEEAGAGPGPGGLLASFAALTPAPGSYGPASGLLPPQGPIPEVEPPPSAAPAAPAPAPRAEAPPEAGGGLADAYVARGTELFKKGQFPASADEFQKAYLLRPKPVYLFNIAQAYRRGARPREALSMYHEFLAKDPRTTLSGETRNYIHDIELLLLEQERAQKVKDELAQKEQQTERVEKDLRLAQQRADRSERERKKPVYRRPWFWGVLGGTVVVVGAGVGIALGVTLGRDPQTDGGIVVGRF